MRSNTARSRRGRSVRKIELTIYEVNELSEESKERAYTDWLRTWVPDAWDDEYRRGLKELQDRFGFGVSQTCLELNSDTPKELSSPVRLAKYVIKRSRIKTLEALDNCPFTGFCGDCAATDIIKKAFLFELDYASYIRFCEEMIEAFFKNWQEDKAYQCSREYFEDYVTANEYSFREDGSRYKES